MRLKLDLHSIFSNDRAIDQALHSIMEEAIEKHAESVEIIPGKGSGQLKKAVLRFLEKTYKGRYSRIEKDDKNFNLLHC